MRLQGLNDHVVRVAERILATLKRNGLPHRKVTLPAAKLYAAADKAGSNLPYLLECMQAAMGLQFEGAFLDWMERCPTDDERITFDQAAVGKTEWYQLDREGVCELFELLRARDIELSDKFVRDVLGDASGMSPGGYSFQSFEQWHGKNRCTFSAHISRPDESPMLGLSFEGAWPVLEVLVEEILDLDETPWELVSTNVGTLLSKLDSLPKLTSMNEVKHALRDDVGVIARPYNTIDFGRSRVSGNLSVLLSQKACWPATMVLRTNLADGLIAFVGTAGRALRSCPSQELVVAEGRSTVDAVKIAQTWAPNYDLSNDDILRRLETYDRLLGITVHVAETDRVEFAVHELPEDLDAWAHALYDFCPDTIDQGLGTVSELVDHIRETRIVTLWWD